MSKIEVKRHPLGFYELANKPTEQELANYYNKTYYQAVKGSYQHSYSDEEIEFINNKMDQKAFVISRHLPGPGQGRCFLDVGCGEGWALAFFSRRGWDVTGLDYSEYACDQFNPQMAPSLRVGDIYQSLRDLRQEGRPFDVIWLTNVLEHVLEPEALLHELKMLVARDGILVVTVPNDFSVLQEYLLQKGHIPERFWVVSPDHISYFTAESLSNLAEASGWKKLQMVADHPIDFNLLNPNTNYVVDKSKGKSCHHARVEIENLLHRTSLEKTVAYYEALADLGLGRSITGFFTV